MAKREIPDFDRAAAFDQALARTNPDLVARLGGSTVAAPAAEVVETVPTAGPSLVQETRAKSESLLKVVPPSNESERAIPTPKRGRRRGVVERANGEELRRLTVYVKLDLAQRLREHCFEHELNLSEVAAEALNLGLEVLIKGARS